jgi:rhodanese-related sulfurtransferase
MVDLMTNPSPGDLPLEIDVRSVQRLIETGEDFVLLDVREQDEYDLVHIPQATLLPMSQIQTRFPELLPLRDRRLVVHCHHGGRSERVTHWLRAQGFPQVQNMAGGIDAWATDVTPGMARY